MSYYTKEQKRTTHLRRASCCKGPVRPKASILEECCQRYSGPRGHSCQRPTETFSHSQRRGETPALCSKVYLNEGVRSPLKGDLRVVAKERCVGGLKKRKPALVSQICVVGFQGFKASQDSSAKKARENLRLAFLVDVSHRVQSKCHYGTGSQSIRHIFGFLSRNSRVALYHSLPDQHHHVCRFLL